MTTEVLTRSTEDYVACCLFLDEAVCGEVAIVAKGFTAESLLQFRTRDGSLTSLEVSISEGPNAARAQMIGAKYYDRGATTARTYPARDNGSSIDYDRGAATAIRTPARYSCFGAGVSFFSRRLGNARGFPSTSIPPQTEVRLSPRVERLRELAAAITGIDKGAAERERPVDPLTGERAIKFLSLLPRYVPPPQMSLSPDGEIGFFWFNNKKRVDAYFDSDGHFTWIGKFHDTFVPGGDIAWSGQLPAAAIEMLSRLYE